MSEEEFIMTKEDLEYIHELVVRKIRLAEVTGGLSSSDRRYINLWNHSAALQEKINQLEKKVKHWVDIYTELKKHTEKAMKTTVKDSNTYKAYKNILDKMQELENGK